jgi:hypothetical protein
MGEEWQGGHAGAVGARPGSQQTTLGRSRPAHMTSVGRKHVAEYVGHSCPCLLRSDAEVGTSSIYIMLIILEA